MILKLFLMEMSAEANSYLMQYEALLRELLFEMEFDFAAFGAEIAPLFLYSETRRLADIFSSADGLSQATVNSVGTTGTVAGTAAGIAFPLNRMQQDACRHLTQTPF